jgi:DNA-directed RNA polymerase alpha subunit
MITEKQCLEALELVKNYFRQIGCENVIDTKNDKRNVNLYFDSDLSVRALNALNLNSEKLGLGINFKKCFVKDLAKISRNNLFKIRRVGSKTIREIELLCAEAGIEMLR